MVKVHTTHNNFARGKIDHDMNGRFDLPIYRSGSDKFQNMISNFKGNAMYRPGLEDMVEFEDCALIEFKFNEAQSYICLFYHNKIKFLTFDSGGNFGFVQAGGGGDLEVTTPYTLAESKQLTFAQNKDVIYLCHIDHEPMKLTRVAADNFTLATYTRTADPFDDPGAGTVGWPGAVAFYKGRLWYGGSTLKITTVWASVAGDFEDHTVGAPIDDDDAMEVTPAEISEVIKWLFPAENSLLVGSNDGITTIHGGSPDTPLTANAVEATLTSAIGADSSPPVAKDGLIFYVGKDKRRIYFVKFDLLSETYEGQDANFVAYDITAGGLSKLKYKKDKDDLVFSMRGDGALVSMNFNEKERVVAFHDHPTNGEIKDIAKITNNEGVELLMSLTERNGVFYIEKLAPFVEFSKLDDFDTGDEDADREAYIRKTSQQLTDCIYLDNSSKFDNLQDNSITFNGSDTITAVSPVFSSGDVGKHIVYKTLTGYESGRFKITAFTSDTVVTVEVLQTPTTNTYSDWYLTFRTITGLSRFNGLEVGVVTDGGFLDTFVVSGGQIELNQETAVVVVGYLYKGVIKSFSLGFVAQAINTHMTLKSINRAGIKTVNSAGGKIGTSLYKLEPVQELKEGDLNYLPPQLLDGTYFVDYSDDSNEDKFMYFVQDEPLPFTLTALMIEGSYV